MNTLKRQARLFRLVRHANPTAILAEGVEWSDSTVALRWRGPWSSTSTWDCIGSVLAMHGSGGRTQVHWLPSAPAMSRTAPQRPVQPMAPVWLPAPTVDGLCSRCGRPWPCLSCGP